MVTHSLYNLTDKVRLLKPSELEEVARGERNIQFFCRAVVEKSDSASTPIRMITDTSRPIYATGSSLSQNAPAAKGFTPSLFSTVIKWFCSPYAIQLDLKVTQTGNPENNNNNILQAAYHSIALSPENFGA